MDKDRDRARDIDRARDRDKGIAKERDVKSKTRTFVGPFVRQMI